MSARTDQAVGRSDAAVFAEARKDLDNCPTVPGTVRVHVEEGVVTLTGTVHHPSQRADAERVVRPAIGDRRLVNHVIVMPSPTEDLELPEQRR